MSDNVKLHPRQNLGVGNRYNYRFDAKNGMDVRLLYKQGDSHKAALLENLYRNKKKTEEGVETFPGYRRILSAFDGAGTLNGVFCHRFGEDETLILHIGSQLYTLSHAARLVERAPRYLGEVADHPSCGASLGESFYLWDGTRSYRIASRDMIAILGDEDYTDEMADLGKLPATNAYIPLAYRYGEAHESRNLLTAYYELLDKTDESRRVYNDFGLKLRSIAYGGGEALEVYGIEKGRSVLYVPDEAEVDGVSLPIVRIAPAAFADSDITVAVISKNVKEILGSSEEYGAFGYCYSLERVCLFGVEKLGERVFEYCDRLREVVLPVSLTIVDPTAFTGTYSLERVYYEGLQLPASVYAFGEAVKVLCNTALHTVSVGEELFFPYDPDKYMTVYGLSEASRRAVGSIRRYGGWSIGVQGNDLGYATVAKKPIALCGLCFDCHLDAEDDCYAFLSIRGDAPLFEESEEPTAVYHIPLPDDVRAIASLTLDGEAASYRGIFGRRDGREYLKAIRLVFPEKREHEVRMRIYANGSTKALGLDLPSDVKATDLVEKARFALVKRGQLYLSGIEGCDGTVSVSAPISVDGMPYFPADGVRTVGREAIVGLLSCKDRVAVLTKNGVSYLDSGAIAEDIAAISALSFRDTRYFLLSDGVYRLKEGVSVSYTHLEKLSAPIEGAIDCFDAAKLFVWQGYLVLLFGREAYLCDLDASYREDGKTLHPWYKLSGMEDFVSALAIADSLYLFTASGDAYLVDPEISDYTFDGRKIEATLVSEAYDLDCGYLYKKPYRKSMTLVYTPLEGGELLVKTREDGKEKLLAVFSEDEREHAVLCPIPQFRERFLSGQLLLSGGAFAFSSFSFRYTVKDRRVK